MPASPTRKTTRPRPLRALAKASPSSASSRSRPASGVRAASECEPSRPPPSRSASTSKARREPATPLSVSSPQIARLEEAGDEPRRRLGDEHAPGRRGRLQARGEVRGVADGGVVHAQVVADAADHHDARVDADAHAEIDAVRVGELLAQRLERALHAERSQHGAPRRVLERDRRAEDRHDAVAGELVHRALVAMDLVEQQREAAVHHRVQLLRTEALGDRRRIDQIGEEHGHVLALALERRARAQDALGEVLRCVGGGAPGAGVAVAGRAAAGRERCAAAVAEGAVGLDRRGAAGAA